MTSLTEDTGAGPSGSAPSKVLIIDDERGPRESLRFLLKDSYEVLCADSAAKGVALLEVERPDVIVLDLRMPGMSGIEGLAAIRAIDTVVSVIILTGYASLDTATEAVRLGANDYLNKPFDIDEIREIIARNVRATGLKRKQATTTLALRELNESLQAELASKDHMANLGQASREFMHDLANPLCVVYGYVQLLMGRMEEIQSGAESQATTDYLAIIQTHLDRCQDLLALWRSMGRGKPDEAKPVDMRGLLTDIGGGAKLLAERAGSVLQMDVALDDAIIHGDATQLFRAINNLAVNAIQALPPEGGLVSLKARSDGAAVTIAIEDDGCGIAPEQAADIFKPNFTTKGAEKGSGLGLFIAQQVIEAHHGSIQVESQPGQGTVFHLSLPLMSAQPVEAGEASC